MHVIRFSFHITPYRAIDFAMMSEFQPDKFKLLRPKRVAKKQQIILSKRCRNRSHRSSSRRCLTYSACNCRTRSGRDALKSAGASIPTTGVWRIAKNILCAGFSVTSVAGARCVRDVVQAMSRLRLRAPLLIHWWSHQVFLCNAFDKFRMRLGAITKRVRG